MTSATQLPSVSVVIPTFNRGDRLLETLRPLLAQPVLEIVVVDDGSSDDTLARLEGLRAEDERVVALGIENSGRPRARLVGVQAARGDVALVLDDDVVAAPGLVAGHGHHHAAKERAVVVGYMPVVSAPRRPGGFPRALYSREYEQNVARWEADPAAILRSYWAGNVSLRRADYMAMADSVAQIEHGYHDDLAFGLACLDHSLHGIFDRSLRATHMYERDPAGFARDAHSSAASLLTILKQRQDVLGPVPHDFPFQGLPRPRRAAGAAAARSASAHQALEGVVRATGQLRLYGVERRAGGLLWRVEQARALQEPRP